MNWTKAQQAAIETTGRDVLVTASAGTGKTAVLSHRVVERIADPADPARADTLLVLTFTDAAAEEMRSRIAETLYERYRKTGQLHLRQQLLLLDRAYISTIHAFCKRILTEFFYLTDLDPAFGIIDADEQRLVKSDVLEATLEQAWADESLASGLEILFAGRRVTPGQNSFVDRIITLADFLDSIPDREQFYENATSHKDLQALQKQLLLKQLVQCRARVEYAMTLDAHHCGGGYLSDYLYGNYMPFIETCQTLLEKDYFDLCARHVADFDPPRMPAFSKKKWPEEIKDRIKGPVDIVKEQLKSLADTALLCSGYTEQIAPQADLQTKVLLQLLKMYDANYAAAKRRRNVLDFADLEHKALNLLEQQHDNAMNVAAILKQRFDYIFVDEYQDINAVQQRILDAISRDDNVFVVGDIKQSIYGFRQSRPDIFLKRLSSAGILPATKRMPNDCQSLRVDLQDNFRCRGEIIDFVNSLFSRVMSSSVADMDYDKRAELVSGFPYEPFAAKTGPQTPVEFCLLDDELSDDQNNNEDTPTQTFSSTQRQAAFIAKRIRQIVGAETGTPQFQVYDKKTAGYRDVQYRDIVILMRSLVHKAQDYVEVFRLAGIPVSSQSACGYFEAVEIADCLSLLKALDNPDRDIELAALLRSPYFNVTDAELALIRHEHKDKCSFYAAVRAYAENGSQPQLKAKAADILTQLNQWRQQAHRGSLADLLDDIFRTKDLLAVYAAMPNGTQRRANLLKLHDHAISFEHFRTTEPGTALSRFVEFLEKLLEAQQDWAPAEPDSSSENAVRIMSVHKSKGLEFPVVFAAQLDTKFTNRDSTGECLISEQTIGLQVPDAAGSGRYPTMAHQVNAELAKRTNLAEEMRILYVALTRAREKLILTGSRKATDIQSLLEEAVVFDSQLPDWKLTEAKCHLDWLITGLADRSNLHNLFETAISQSLPADSTFEARCLDRDSLKKLAETILIAKSRTPDIPSPPKSGSKDDKVAKAAFEQIRQNLAWTYLYQPVTELPAKLSVSAITHRDDEFSRPDTARAFSQKPAVLSKQAVVKHPGALALGSAMHRIIEHLDLSEPVTKKSIENTINQLTQQNLLDTSLSKHLNTESISSFFQTTPGRLAQAAGANVLREWPFTYALDAAAVNANTSNESIILQGIVDMIIPNENGLTIVDFKTDRIDESAIPQRTQLYSEQLRHYAIAAAAILKQPITGIYLYFLHPQQAVEVEILGGK